MAVAEISCFCCKNGHQLIYHGQKSYKKKSGLIIFNPELEIYCSHPQKYIATMQCCIRKILQPSTEISLNAALEICCNHTLEICCNPALTLWRSPPVLISPRGLLLTKPTSGKAIKMPIDFYNPFPLLALSRWDFFDVRSPMSSIVDARAILLKRFHFSEQSF